jgi:hypothetical protein
MDMGLVIELHLCTFDHEMRKIRFGTGAWIFNKSLFSNFNQVYWVFHTTEISAQCFTASSRLAIACRSTLKVPSNALFSEGLG